MVEIEEMEYWNSFHVYLYSIQQDYYYKIFICSNSLLSGHVLSIRESISSSATGDPSHKGHVKEEGQGQEQDRKQTSLFRFFDTEDEVASRDVDFHS